MELTGFINYFRGRGSNRAKYVLIIQSHDIHLWGQMS